MISLKNWLQKGTPSGLVLLAFLVGVGGAAGALLFHALIYLSTWLFYGHNSSTTFLSLIETVPVWQRILIPAFGGLLVGLIYKYARVSEAEGEGVPEVMEALAHHKGTIRPIVAPIKIITAAITLGSGGSAGREGPVIQIGSAIGSGIAQVLNMATPNRSLLLAAGAAAAIGGTFGAPIAGVLFTIEILRHRPKLLETGIITLASYVSTYCVLGLIGQSGLHFSVPPIPPINIPLVMSLGGVSILCALVALFFGKALHTSQKLFQYIPVAHWVKPGLGGLLIGFIGLFLPTIHEPAAYPLMVDLLSVTTLPLTILCVLLLVKIIATSITLGSGGSGGMFAPLLLMGALTGSSIGIGLTLCGVVPLNAIPILAVVGTAAMFASAAHAPLTAAFITFEMTGNVLLLPILILCCYVASSLSSWMSPQSLYHIHDQS